jgi:hypothetical protein
MITSISEKKGMRFDPRPTATSAGGRVHRQARHGVLLEKVEMLSSVNGSAVVEIREIPSKNFPTGFTG